MVKIGDALGIDNEDRVKLEVGVKMIIHKFHIHQGKGWKTARIDAEIVPTGKKVYYYTVATAIVGQLETLKDMGVLSDIEATSVMRHSDESGHDYMVLE